MTPIFLPPDQVSLESTGHCNMRLDTMSLTSIPAEDNQRNPLKGISSELVLIFLLGCTIRYLGYYPLYPYRFQRPVDNFDRHRKSHPTRERVSRFPGSAEIISGGRSAC